MADAITTHKGIYATACESSPSKNLIDQWLNEGRAYSWISRELEKKGEKISDKSISKYAQYRQDDIQRALMKDPLYQAQIQTANNTLVEEVGKIKQVNVLNHIADTIEHAAKLIKQADMDDIRIRTVQDLRYTQMTMLEALKLYGDTMLKAQQLAEIQKDPTLLRPTVNVNVKSVLTDLMGGMTSEQRTQLVDRLRAGFSQSQQGGLSGDTSGDRSDSMDRELPYIEGEAILVPES